MDKKLLQNKKLLFFKTIVALSLLFSPLAINFSLGQTANRTLKGVVVEKGSNEPLVGASIWIKDTSAGTITNLDGSFSLSIPDNRTVTIVVRYISYRNQEIEIGVSKNDLRIEMEAQAEQLAEVQVVGYGTQKRESVIGAISTIRPNELKVPTGAISNNLIGKLSGIVSIQRSGEPGASSEFWLRGLSTFGANKTPLILVDGVERSLDLLDPEEIESFSLLKDATATALYGVRGANGVVLIHTRRGEEGKPKISIKFESGLVQPTKIPKMADAVDYANLYNEMMGYDYYPQSDIQKYRDGSDPDLFPNVNWIDETFKSHAFNQRLTANVSGGGEIARYFVSASFYHEDGILKSEGGSYNGNPDFKRYNFRSNVDINLSRTTELSLTLGGFLKQQRRSANMDDIWKYSFLIPSNSFPIRYSNGYWAGQKGLNNPYHNVTRAGYTDDWSNTLNSLMELKQDFGFVTKGLTASVKFAFDAQSWHINKYTRQDDVWFASGRDANDELIFTTPEINKGGPWFSKTSGGNNSTYLEASINYSREFGKHHVGALILYNQRVYKEIKDTAIGSLPYKNQGLAGRLTYDYDSRYFIEGNFGYNGSENFASGNRVGFFPSIALGWMISNEPFFRPINHIVYKLKLRASVGQVGNDKIGGDVRFIYLGTVATTDGYLYGDYTNQTGERVNEVANPYVSWEVSTKQNYGIEIGLFNKNKIDIQVDWYNDVRDDIFVRNNNIPAYVGLITTPMVNVGKMKSWGLDASVEYQRNFGDLYFSARGTFTYAANEILRDGDERHKYPYLNTTGQKLYQKWGLQAIGLFESEEEVLRSPTQFSEAIHSTLRPGDIKYQDINGDGVVDDNDRIPIGYCDVPEITYGAGATLAWKGIDFSFFIQGIGRVSAFEEGSTMNPFTSGYANNDGFHKEVVNNHWTEANPNSNARYPRLNGIASGQNSNMKRSSFWMRDATYLRLKNMEIGYSLPKRWVNKIRMQNIRIYVSGVNLLTWSADMHLFDPELGTTDGRSFPPTRVFNLGVNINF